MTISLALVGDVSMDVLCFIWDQCFIGMDTVGYQCLPYITATWLILLREKLMSCTLVRHACVLYLCGSVLCSYMWVSARECYMYVVCVYTCTYMVFQGRQWIVHCYYQTACLTQTVLHLFLVTMSAPRLGEGAYGRFSATYCLAIPERGSEMGCESLQLFVNCMCI